MSGHVVTTVEDGCEPRCAMASEEQVRALRTILFAEGIVGSMTRTPSGGWDIAIPRRQIRVERAVA